MKIDFYHIDAFETAVYEPIWRELVKLGVDARLVAVPGRANSAAAGWFDYETCKRNCADRDLPLFAEVDPDADMAITTQDANILRQYRMRTRVMYGPILYPKAWGLQPKSVLPFNHVLVHGEAYAERFSQWLPRNRLHVTGYPRYDDYFNGSVSRTEVRAGWNVSDGRPSIVFMPTWADNTSFDNIFPELVRLSKDYNIIVRPHHCTVRMEPHRMSLMRTSGMLVLDSNFDLLKCFAGADVIISDARSGAMFEALMCGVPTVGLVLDPSELTGWVGREGLDELVSLCWRSEDLEKSIMIALANGAGGPVRQDWRERHTANLDGGAAKVAAKTIIGIVESGTVPRRTYSFASGNSYPVKVSIVLPTYNHGVWLPQAVESIANQTLQDFELIIVNDGSTDNTAEYLSRLTHRKIKVVSQENRGLPAALNVGFSHARGQYWTWTSADNVVGRTWLEELSGALDACGPDIGYALSYFANINRSGAITTVENRQCFETYSMFQRNGNASFLYRSELAKLAGLYDTELTGAEDLDMWLRMSLLTRAVLVESILYYYRVHDDTMTVRNRTEVRSASVRTLEKFISVQGGINVDAIFPGIARSAEPNLARWQARIWLASRLANVPSENVVEAVVMLLLASLKERYEEVLVGNIVHILGRLGVWNILASLLAEVGEQFSSPALHSYADIVARKDALAAAQIKLASIPSEKLVFDLDTQISRKGMQ